MSYILDALRKSEEQRRGATTPDLTTEHRPDGRAGRGRRRSLMLLGAALAVALLANAALGILWLLPSTGSESTPATEPGSAAPAAAAPPPAAGSVADARRDAAAAPDSVADRAPARTAAPTAAGPTATAAAARDASDQGSSDRVAPDRISPDRVAADRVAPEPIPIRDLPDSVQRRIPPLSFSTHIYTDDPQFREVAINGRNYVQGDRIGPLTLVEITETGVVLQLDQWRFSISVLEDWDY